MLCMRLNYFELKSKLKKIEHLRIIVHSKLMSNVNLFKVVMFYILESKLYLEEQVLEPANGFAVNLAKSKGKRKSLKLKSLF